jgi:hypothetical protein
MSRKTKKKNKKQKTKKEYKLEREKLAEILLSLGLLVCGTMPRSIQG